MGQLQGHHQHRPAARVGGGAARTTANSPQHAAGGAVDQLAGELMGAPLRQRIRNLLIASIVLVAAGAATLPLTLPAGTLYWAKWSAKRKMSNLTPEQRANLNAVPAMIVLPPMPAD